jgi:FPC/CPF motif-containing protein YcgG
MGVITPQQALSLYGSANPFVSAEALRYSNYSAPAGPTLVRLLDWRRPAAQAVLADRAIRGFILGPGFSCVAGKAAVSAGGYRFGHYPGFGDRRAAEGLARDLAAFVAEQTFMPSPYTTFVAVFEEPASGDEQWFETQLWQYLQRLADLGSLHYEWDRAASTDATDSNFAFSFAGRAFFVVGMHQRSSRLTRRFSSPVLVFNTHRQFDDARKSGRFERIQGLVRAREMDLQGSINPELRAFGESSEARQYAGRRTEEEWKCPFRPPS